MSVQESEWGVYVIKWVNEWVSKVVSLCMFVCLSLWILLKRLDEVKVTYAKHQAKKTPCPGVYMGGPKCAIFQK